MQMLTVLFYMGGIKTIDLSIPSSLFVVQILLLILFFGIVKLNKTDEHRYEFRVLLCMMAWFCIETLIAPWVVLKFPSIELFYCFVWGSSFVCDFFVGLYGWHKLFNIGQKSVLLALTLVGDLVVLLFFRVFRWLLKI